MNIFRYIFLTLCAAVEIGLLGFGFIGIGIFLGEENPNVPIGMVLAWTVGSLALLVITGIGFHRTYKGREKPLIRWFLFKIPVFIITFGFMWFALDIPEAGWLAVIIGAILALLFFVIIRLDSGSALGGSGGRSRAKPIKPPEFYADKAKWAWDDAALEYLRLKGEVFDTESEEGRKAYEKRIAALTESETEHIYDCAGMPIAFFLGWLIDRDLVSEAFVNLHSPEALQAFRDGQRTPLGILKEMDYVLAKDDIKEAALPFMVYYYEIETAYMPLSSRIPKYFLDYYQTVCSGYDLPRYYCAEFNWPDFRELEKILDLRYSDFNREYSVIPEDMDDDGQKLGNAYFDTEAALCHEPGTPPEYVQLCADAYQNMNEELRREMSDHLIEFCTENLPDEEVTVEKVLRKFEPEYLIVFRPPGGWLAAGGGTGEGEFEPVPAYVLLGSSEWEEEHGIALTVVGDCVVSSSFYADAEPPWGEELIWKYRIRTDARRGNYCKAEVIPASFGGRLAADNQVTIPVAAAMCKKEMDRRIEAMFMLKMAAHYDCRFTYDGDQPNYLFVSATKGDRRTFADSIPLR